jgi:hypothetical protein
MPVVGDLLGLGSVEGDRLTEIRFDDGCFSSGLPGMVKGMSEACDALFGIDSAGAGSTTLRERTKWVKNGGEIG